MADMNTQDELQQLRATNAAQAEQLAKLGGALQRWLGIAQHCSITEGVCCCGDNMAGHSDPMQCGHMATDHGEYVTSMLIEETNALLQSSIPPELQAGVEPDLLKDLKWRIDDIRDDLMGGGRGHSVYGIDEWSVPSQNLRKASDLIERALNQRQAVKAEPIGRGVYLMDDKYEEAITELAAEKDLTNLQIIKQALKLYQMHERRFFAEPATTKPEPLSAAQGVPEIIGTVVSVDVSTGDENFGDRIYGRVFAIQDDVLLVEETGRNFKPEHAQTAVGLPEPAWWRLHGDVYEVQQHNITTDEPIPNQEPLFAADQMESYATAKTAEAVQNALEEAAMLFNQKHQEYFGSDIQDAIRSMTKYAPKKEQGNG